MFPDKNLGYGFAHGWFPGFVSLCESIDVLLGPDKRKFHWTQLKEKMGSGRYHFAIQSREPIVDSGLLARIRKLIENAEAQTLDMCIYCGEPGALHNHKGYLSVRCDLHRKLAESGNNESPWL
jgi:hypothetical protein